MKSDSQNKASFLKGLFNRNEIIFGVCFIMVFFVTFLVLYMLGLIPAEFLVSVDDNPTVVEQVQNNSLKQFGLVDTPTPIKSTPSKNSISFIPTRIEAPSIDLNTAIENTNSTDYQTLDNALVHGAVHYPGSGGVEEGNMFIFGHSTGFRFVNNKAYQVFNNIHSLKTGDEINIYTPHKKYTYKVNNVRLVDSREALVNFDDKSRTLTLSTCNSFGAKTDRYVVQASFDHSIDI